MIKLNKMKYKNIIDSFIIISLITFSWIQHEKTQDLKIKVLDLKEEKKECIKIMNHQLENIKQKNEVIKNFYNYTARTQLLIGVDTIDNVFTFEERLKNPIKVKNVLRCVKP